MLSGFEQALLALLLVVLMAGMGAGLTLDDFRSVLRSPKGPVIGFLSQYGWMPLLAFVLGKALGLPADLAISLIIVGCTPGGTTSNLFTYFAKADVALSISMTALSTIAAVVMMPVLLAAYTAGSTLEIPYQNITVTLALMLVPLALGMVLRSRAPRAAARAERLGSLSGLGVLLLLVVAGLVRSSGFLAQTTPAMVAAAFGLAALGFGLGYLGAAALRVAEPGRRAIAFETGIQNSPLALGIIVVSFPPALQDRMLWLPILYALFTLLSASLLTLWWRRSA